MNILDRTKDKSIEKRESMHDICLRVCEENAKAINRNFDEGCSMNHPFVQLLKEKPKIKEAKLNHRDRG